MLLYPAAASRGERADAFSTLAVGVDLMVNVNDEQFHEYWDPRAGFRLDLETPFYLGLAQLGLHVYENDNKRDEVPEFWSGYLYLGWLGEKRAGPMRLGFGALAGNLIMDFAENPLTEVKKIESELAIAGIARLEYDVTDKWSMHAGGEARRVYTAERIDLVFVSVGVRRSFDSPRWLREVLD